MKYLYGIIPKSTAESKGFKITKKVLHTAPCLIFTLKDSSWLEFGYYKDSYMPPFPTPGESDDCLLLRVAWGQCHWIEEQSTPKGYLKRAQVIGVGGYLDMASRLRKLTGACGLNGDAIKNYSTAPAITGNYGYSESWALGIHPSQDASLERKVVTIGRNYSDGPLSNLVGGLAVSGDGGISVTGRHGLSVSGYSGRSLSGYCGHSVTGCGGVAHVAYGVASAGLYGTAQSCNYKSYLRAGSGGTLIWGVETKHVIHFNVDGKNIKADRYYHISWDDHRFCPQEVPDAALAAIGLL